MLSRLYQALGPLRIAMAMLSLLTIILMPSPGTEVVYEGWAIMPTVVAPAVAPILVAVYLLDILMSFVFSRSPGENTKRRHFHFIILSDALFVSLLLAVWIPLIMALAV
ncbi:conserved hypothetical protein [Thioalkalivibrio sulfidiphilus HL-EbGr7]|uniref:Uncharacterized protein n=2 Tax=Thioalkalivibrio TaxID=106633 RepID=B8GLZ9_THISH|nr:conserved hypothetical protein [Thioalkalivibrio sulfidiphilus HL-EbGr7]